MSDYKTLKQTIEDDNSPIKHPENWLSPQQMKDNLGLVKIANHPLADARQAGAALEQLRRNGVTNVPN